MPGPLAGPRTSEPVCKTVWLGSDKLQNKTSGHVELSRKQQNRFGTSFLSVALEKSFGFPFTQENEGII